MFHMIASLFLMGVVVVGVDITMSLHRPNPPSTEEDGTIPPREFWEYRGDSAADAG